jgi:hypothetical protein
MPLVLIVTTLGFVRHFTNTSRTVLDRQRNFVTLIPELEQKLHEAEQVLLDLAPGAREGVGVEEALSSALNAAAREAGFTIDALSVRADAPQPGGGRLATFAIDIQGHGPLGALVRFCNQAQDAHWLLSVDKARITAMGSETDAPYKGDILLRYHELSS